MSNHLNNQIDDHNDVNEGSFEQPESATYCGVLNDQPLNHLPQYTNPYVDRKFGDNPYLPTTGEITETVNEPR
jgi:hypothetical protein